MARLVQGENSFPREDTALDREGCCISRGCDCKHNWIGRLVRWGAAAAVEFFGRNQTNRCGPHLDRRTPSRSTLIQVLELDAASPFDIQIRW